MTTTPEGDAPWTRSATATTYGGHSDKKDYQSLGSINPRTDFSVAQFLRMTADLSACARVAAFSSVSLTCNDTSPAAPTIDAAHQMNGVAPTGYTGDSPPSGFPTFTRVANGSVQGVWPSAPSDDFSVSATFAIKHVRADVVNHGSYSGVEITKVSDTTFTFEAVDSGGSAISDAEIHIEVA